MTAAPPRSSSQPAAYPAETVWKRLDFDALRVPEWRQFRHREQVELLHRLTREAAIPVGFDQVGKSDEGRALNSLRFGRGKRRVLVWARQHGDEPDCTAGLCAVLLELLLRPTEPDNALILDRLDLAVLPMVNPDGVARFTRRNAQGIDINRDAVARATPEGSAIIALKEAFDPEYCFNLHDMNPRKSANGRHLVALAFQAGPFEQRDIDNPVRLKAKAICGLMTQTARLHAPDGISRYTADYMPTAFGDSMMRWGVSSILIEAGGWRPDAGGDDFVRRLFALALHRGLYAIAAAEDATPSGDLYETIPFDSTTYFCDVVLEKGTIINGHGRPPFRADLAFNVNTETGRTGIPLRPVSTIENLGDLGHQLGIQRLSVADHVILPGLTAIDPAVRFDKDLPSPEEAMRFLRAGITTLACGFGPFEGTADHRTWIEERTAANPLLNIIAYERVGAIEDVRARHGLTAMAGFVVQGYALQVQDLVSFMHLFHPASHSAIEQEHFDRLIGVDLYFEGASTPLATHLHLHLTPLDDDSAHRHLPVSRLRDFATEFFVQPNQLTTSIDALGGDTTWLPLLLGYGGLSHGRFPSPNFLGKILRHYGATEASAVLAALNRLTVNSAGALRLKTIGSIGIGQRADLTVFRAAALTGEVPPEDVIPRKVFLNGQLVIDRDSNHELSGEGAWLLAANPQDR